MWPVPFAYMSPDGIQAFVRLTKGPGCRVPRRGRKGDATVLFRVQGRQTHATYMAAHAVAFDFLCAGPEFAAVRDFAERRGARLLHRSPPSALSGPFQPYACAEDECTALFFLLDLLTDVLVRSRLYQDSVFYIVCRLFVLTGTIEDVEWPQGACIADTDVLFGLVRDEPGSPAEQADPGKAQLFHDWDDARQSQIGLADFLDPVSCRVVLVRLRARHGVLPPPPPPLPLPAPPLPAPPPPPVRRRPGASAGPGLQYPGRTAPLRPGGARIRLSAVDWSAGIPAADGGGPSAVFEPAALGTHNAVNRRLPELPLREPGTAAPLPRSSVPRRRLSAFDWGRTHAPDLRGPRAISELASPCTLDDASRCRRTPEPPLRTPVHAAPLRLAGPRIRLSAVDWGTGTPAPEPEGTRARAGHGVPSPVNAYLRSTDAGCGQQVDTAPSPARLRAGASATSIPTRNTRARLSGFFGYGD